MREYSEASAGIFLGLEKKRKKEERERMCVIFMRALAHELAEAYGLATSSTG